MVYSTIHGERTGQRESDADHLVGVNKHHKFSPVTARSQCSSAHTTSTSLASSSSSPFPSSPARSRARVYTLRSIARRPPAPSISGPPSNSGVRTPRPSAGDVGSPRDQTAGSIGSARSGHKRKLNLSFEVICGRSSCLCNDERFEMISGNHADEELQQASCRKVEQPAAKGAVAGSRHWSASTESRIVRVSRVFGGKDRHSKVRTVKGLRDRRVRLSVPTAIQLYDLQDRLGVSQPSKAVDWLLNVAQHEIDRLPPLQFPPQDLVSSAHHLPSSVAMAPPFSNAAAATTGTASMLVDGDKAAAHCDGGHKGFMSLNNSLGQLVNGAGAMPSLAHASYHHYAAEPWSNGSVHEVVSGHRASPQVVAHHSPFPSLLSLAPSQLVFYSSEGGGFAMKEAAGDQFPVDNLDDSQGQLSLSSARSFLHSGSQG